MRARGVAGHASVPGLGDNALLKLAPALERLREQPPLEPTPEGMAFVAALSGEEIDPQDDEALEAAVGRLREAAPEVTADPAEPMLRVTLVPTEASASTKENVIPSHAEVLVDCRVPPGMGRSEALERALAVLGEAGEGLRAGVHADGWLGTALRPTPPLPGRSRNGSPMPTREPLLVPIVMAGLQRQPLVPGALRLRRRLRLLPAARDGPARGDAARPRRGRACVLSPTSTSPARFYGETSSGRCSGEPVLGNGASADPALGTHGNGAGRSRRFGSAGWRFATGC